ncbi:hypothetical protein [Micromonospora chersina]|uniref:hypothetical protein n=1 Tax=Micromonospora chersina TaxID=47854 RepID=UPI0033FA6049
MQSFDGSVPAQQVGQAVGLAWAALGLVIALTVTLDQRPVVQPATADPLRLHGVWAV